MYFEPFGPFDLRPTLRSEDRYWKSKFWKAVNSRYHGLSSANGIYIFSIKFGSNFMPWYVGKTCSAMGFCGEVFQDHKIEHYFEAAGQRRGREYLHLIARVEDTRGNYCKWSERSEDQIDQVETFLIGMALAKNPVLRNSKKTKLHRSLNIAGVIGEKYEGRPREDARTLKNVLGLTLP